MLFQSLDFLLLFPIVIVVYFALNTSYRWVWVLLTSYGFYMFWNPWYIVLLWTSTVLDYVAAIRIHSSKKQSVRKGWLILSLIVNLGLLGIFKYFNFFSEQFAWLIRLRDPDFEPFLLDFLLPIGISFYTFQTIGYTIDVFRKNQQPVRHLGKFAIYVSFFPQLVAGPIERARDLLPQLHFNYKFDAARVTGGLRLFLWGLFKKLVVADYIGLYVGSVYATPDNHGGWTVLFASYLFFFQIYYDFSAYQDMAVGTARILGVRLSKNFDPLILLSSSFRNFWRGWHITLTHWIRDYVYIPLNLNEKNLAHLSIGPLYIFFFVGLWHGANWTYIIWGVLHGIYMIIERALQPVSTFLDNALLGKRGIKFLGFLLFFNAFTLANIFFCSTSAEQAIMMIGKIFTAPTVSLNPGISSFKLQVMLTALAFAVVFEYSRKHLPTLELLNLKHTWLRWSLYLLMGLAVWFLRIPSDVQFIYFEF